MITHTNTNHTHTCLNPLHRFVTLSFSLSLPRCFEVYSFSKMCLIFVWNFALGFQQISFEKIKILHVKKVDYRVIFDDEHAPHTYTVFVFVCVWVSIYVLIGVRVYQCMNVNIHIWVRDAFVGPKRVVFNFFCSTFRFYRSSYQLFSVHLNSFFCIVLNIE